MIRLKLRACKQSDISCLQMSINGSTVITGYPDGGNTYVYVTEIGLDEDDAGSP